MFWKTFKLSVVGDRLIAECSDDSAPRLKQFTLHPDFEDDFQDVKEALERSREIRAHHLRRFGKTLYRSLFPDEIRRAFVRQLDSLDENEYLRVFLNINESNLSTYPWEFLHDEDEEVKYLSRHPKIGFARWVRLNQPLPPLKVEFPLRMLVIISNPPGARPFDWKSGLEAIKQAVKPLGDDKIMIEELLNPSIEEVKERVVNGKFHLIHYLGHGEYSEGNGYLILKAQNGKADRVHEDAVADAFLAAQTVRLVCLNACESGMQVSYRTFSGTAMKLMQHNLPAVVAMQHPITARDARTFSQVFYEGIIRAGLPVDVAVNKGRQAISLNGQKGRLRCDFGTPVIFLRNEKDQLFTFLAREQDLADSSIEVVTRDYTASPFATLIDEHTQNFVGREFVFEEIDKFIAEHPRGYFIIKGEPGIGKTALMAQLAKTRNYIHHFNIAAQGIRRPDEFLESVCPRLIEKYQLNLRFSANEKESGAFLNRVLKEVSTCLEDAGEKEIILVDALDEAERSSARENLLFLPRILPPHIYFALTSRPVELPLRIDMDEVRYYPLEADGEGNLLDVRHYLQQEIGRGAEPIAEELNRRGISEEAFIKKVIENSKGNFMYLFYLMGALRRGDYTPLDLNRLPKGLEGYYDDFWRRLRERDLREWRELYRPLLSVLTVAQEALSCSQLAAITEIPGEEDVREVISDLQEFLYSEKQVAETAYRIYHYSFQEFLEEKIDKATYHYRIAEFYSSQIPQLFPNYPLLYLPYHYFQSGAQGYDKLYRLIENEHFRQSKLSRFGIMQQVLEDVAYGLQAALKQDDLPRMVRYGRLYPEIKEHGKQRESVLQLAQAGKFDKALDRINSLYRDELKRFRLLLLAADVAGEQGEMKRVEEFVEQAVTIPDISIAENDHWLIVNVLQWLIRKGSRAGAALLNKIRETKGLFPREKIELFKKVTDKMVQAGGGEWLVQSCDHLIRTGENLDDTEEQAEAFVIIARLLLDMHESEAAQDLLERSLTLTEGVQDDLTKSLISSRIAEVLAQIPDKDWAKSGLQRLIHVVEGIADAWWKAWALGAVARAARGMGDVATGRALLEQMIPVAAGIAEAYGKAEAMGALAQAAAGLGDVASGRVLLEQAVSVATGIAHEEWKAEALGALAQAAAGLGDVASGRALLEQAVSVAAGIADEVKKATALWALARVAGEPGDVASGRALLEQMIPVAAGIADARRKAWALGALARAAGGLGDVASGRALLEQAISVVAGIADEERKAEALRTLAQMAGEPGDVASGRALLEQMIPVAAGIADARRKAEALRALAQAAGGLADGASGRALLEQAVSVAAGIADEKQKAAALEALAQAAGGLADPASGWALLEQAIAMATGIADERGKAEALEALAQAAGGLADVASGRVLLEQAVLVAAGIADEKQKAEALEALAQAAGGMGDVASGRTLLEQAVSVAAGIADEKQKAAALEALVQAAGGLGDVVTGRALLEQMIPVTAGIADAWGKATALGALAQAAGGLADVASGRALLEQAVSVAAGIADEAGKAQVLGELAQAAGNLEDVASGRALLEQAVSVVAGSTNPMAKAWVLGELARAAGGLGDVVSGRALLEQMIPVAAGSDWVLEAVVRAAAELGELGLCERIIPDIRDDQLASEAISAYTVTVAMKRSLDEVLHLVQTISVFGVRMECIRKLAGRWGIKKPPPDPLQRGNKERLKAILPLAVEDLNTGYVVLSELLPFYDDPQALIDAAKILGVNISS